MIFSLMAWLIYITNIQACTNGLNTKWNNDHSEYRVTVSGLNSDTMPSYTYTFKTFSEKGSGVNGTVSDSAAENTTTN